MKIKKNNKKRIFFWIILISTIILIVISLFYFRMLGSKHEIKLNEKTIVAMSGNHNKDFTDLSLVGNAEFNEDCIETYLEELDIFWFSCLAEHNEEWVDCYEGCETMFPDEEEFTSENNYGTKIYKFLEIIPSVQAVYVGDLPSCYDDCDDSYWTEDMLTECEYDVMGYMTELGCVSIPVETSEWDGSEIMNISEFFITNFPNSIDAFKNSCESWLIGGNWVDENDVIGCFDLLIFRDTFCNDEGVNSANDVCITIGGNFTCIGEEISCRI